ncbi:Uncharacterised protein [Vibrio cholerae]|nr:Uncharacterised protein [Vibrio cholerae]CSC34019.1 Uncharacterised protein [Vibrio cholerae]
MIFGLFAVKAVRRIHIVVIRQCDCCGGSNRNAFVSRAKQHIKFNT